MLPVIRPGLAVFRRNPTQLQFGAADDDCFVVDDRPGLLGLLRLLNGVRETPTIACLARERVTDLADDPEALIAALHDKGIIVDATSCAAAEPGLDAEARSLLAQRLSPDETGDRLIRRSQAHVEIRPAPSTEPLAATIVDGLHQAGIQTTRAADSSATLSLIIGEGPTHRSVFAHLQREQMPHLAVTVDGARVFVGPFVYPGLTPCVGCLDLWRSDCDPCWTAVTTQFDAPLAYACDAGDHALSSATRLAAAATITHDIAAFSDETTPHTTSRTITIGPDINDRIDAATAFHPGCPCRRKITELADPTQ